MRYPSPASRIARAVSLTALFLILAHPVMAENAPMLEEIIVTAEHRETSLQKTEISMSAFDAQSLRALGISNGLDLFGYAPNMNVQQYQGGRTGISYSIRGIVNAETLVTFDPGVSVYLDNVLISKNVGSQLDVADLERVEILRGPQGTLYGRNTMGGAVNYVTRKPQDEFEASLRGTVGDYGRWDVRGMVNLPVLGSDSSIGELNMRVAAATINRDGVQDNKYKGPGTDNDLGTWDREVSLWQLQWQPVDTVTVLYNYDRTRIDEVPVVPWATITNDVAPGPTIAPFVEADENDYPKNVYSDFPHNTGHTSVDGHGLNIGWNVTDSLSLHSITGYRKMDNFGAADTDGTPYALLSTEDKQRFNALSQEFRAVGSALDGQLDYTGGVFYFNENGDVYNTVTAYGAYASPSNTVAKYHNDAWAVYGQATYHFTDRLSFTGGARYTSENRDMDKALLTQVYPDPFWYNTYVTYPGVADTIFPQADKDFDNTSWLASLGYDWTDDLMTYVKVSTGFQSGGFNVRDTDPRTFTEGFKDETLTSYEIGMKSTWAERFVVNAAVFYGDYSDKQVNVFDAETLGNVRQNADVEIWGAELEVLAQLTESWQAGLGYGYLDPEFKSFYDPQGNDVSNSTNFTYAPDNTANGHIAYTHGVGFGTLNARVDWTYRDDMHFLAPAPEPNSSGSFSLFNARIGIDDIQGPGDTTVRVALWGKNLADEGYWTSGVDVLSSFGYAFNLWGDPRTYGLDVEIDF